jgi:hypothetical protein
MSDSKTIAVKNRDIHNIVRALNALDGRPEAVTVKDETQILVVPYKIGAKTRLLAAKWLNAAKAVADTVSKTHDGLVRQFADPKEPDKVAPAKNDEFAKEWDLVQDATNEFALDPLKLDDLKIEENQLPISVLSVLSDIAV